MGLPVLTEQNRQARVQTSPININVAVPRPQHSAMFGHFDSAQTVGSRPSWTMSRTFSNPCPEGNLTRSQGGFGPMSGSLTCCDLRNPPLTATVPSAVTPLVRAWTMDWHQTRKRTRRPLQVRSTDPLEPCSMPGLHDRNSHCIRLWSLAGGLCGYCRRLAIAF